jgi:NADH-quinone oxidoreductase subunit E
VVNYVTSVVSKGTSLVERVRHILASFPRERSLLITILERVQEELGYLPNEAIEDTAKHLRMSNSEVFGVATFYNFFRFVPSARHEIKVCLGTACHVRQGDQVYEAVAREIGVEAGQVTPDMKFSLERVACFGSCALAPVMVVDKTVYGRMTPSKARDILKQVDHK